MIMKLFKPIAISIFALAAFTAPAQYNPTNTLPADQQGYPQTFYVPTNLPTVVPAASGSNQTSIVTITPGKGAGFTWSFSTQATNVVKTAIVYIYASVDGTNYAANPFATLTGTPNGTSGTNVVTFSTNWSSATLAGFYSLNISEITNTAGSSILTNWVFLVNKPQN